MATPMPPAASSTTGIRDLPLTEVVRYVAPLREGGSLPGVVEGDDDGTWVAKFTGAGQGPGVLVAEVVVAALADRLELPVPKLVLLELDPAIGRLEADAEIAGLLLASVGTNLGMDFLPGSTTFDGTVFDVAADRAALVRWLDAFVGNIDRTWRNPNLLVWHDGLWLIDHGASLPWQHAWARRDALGDEALAAGRSWTVDLHDHVLVGSGSVTDAHERATAGLDVEAIEAALAAVPYDWLAAVAPAVGADGVRAAHLRVLGDRLATRDWLDTVDHPPVDVDAVRAATTRPERPGWVLR